jgi:hypothetical protein
VTRFLGGHMTDQPPGQGRPDDWNRGGYVPGEQYYDQGAGSSQRDPARGDAQPRGPQPGTPGQGAAQQRGPQPRAPQPGAGPQQGGWPGAPPQQGGWQQGAPPPGAFQEGVFPQHTLQQGAGQQGAGQQGAGQQSSGQLGAAEPGLPRQGADSKGFFGALFDFSFTSFVTTRIIKVLYALIMVLAVLSALLFTITMFRISAGLGLATLIIGDPLFIIIVMAFWRLVLESFVVVFRIAEDVRALRERGDR